MPAPVPDYKLAKVANFTQFFDNLGQPLSGGKIFTYVNNSFSVQQTTWSLPGGASPNANPIVLDSSERVTTAIFIDNTIGYQFVLTKAVDQHMKFFRRFPFTVHHLAITRKGTISERALKCITQMNTIYDWPMRLDAAVNFGIKRLPEVGYAWRKHSQQETQSPNRNKYLQHSLDVVRKEYAQ